MEITTLLDIHTRAELYRWFEENHASAKEFWIRVNRSAKDVPGVIRYDDAVEVALCFGWIDSTLKRLDGGKPAQRFSPRRKGSNWCGRNLSRCRRLIALGQMTPAGLALLPKMIEVVAAVIIRDGKVFATQRGYGPWKDWWEFPGGKIEPGESPQEALAREIREELSAEIEVGRLLRTVEWDYPEFHLTMHCFLCSPISAGLHLNEHEAARWLSPSTLRSVAWLPADEGLLPEIARLLGE